MTYPTLDTVNTSRGVYPLFVYANEIVPIFNPMLLFFIYFVAALGSFFAQKRLAGTSDLPASLTVAGMITSVIAILFSLIPGMINLGVVVLIIGITILSFIWLVFSREQ